VAFTCSGSFMFVSDAILLRRKSAVCTVSSAFPSFCSCHA